MTAACSGHPEPLWDSTLPHETDTQREARHERAKAVCRVCGVREWCESTIRTGDDGVRAGRVLPHIEDKHRRSPYGEESETVAFLRSLRQQPVAVRSPETVEFTRLVKAGVNAEVARLLAEAVATAKAA